MKIYTKFGDRGETALFDGTRVGKDDGRIETYGTVDELNSWLGFSQAACKDSFLRDLLVELQGQLLTLGSDLATPIGAKNEAKVRRITVQDVQFLERQIDQATAQLAPLKRFILPGGSEAAGRLHIARTVCRRAERCLVRLIHDTQSAGLEQQLIYLNRLSDLLFTLARLANQLDGSPDVEWNGHPERNKTA